MKTKRLLIPFTILLTLALAAQAGLAVLPQEPAQAAPGVGPGLFLPFITGGKPPVTTVFGIAVGGLSNAQMLATTEAADPTWLRQSGLDWGQIQPTQNGSYDWSSASSAEADMIKASQEGYKLIQIVNGTPDWAQKYPGSPCGPIKQSEFTSFANFVKAAVERYSAPPYNVQYWEIGNEPDAPIQYSPSLWGCWGDPSLPYYGGQYYGEMLTSVIPSIRQANPNAKILNGGLLLDCDPSLSSCGNPGMASFLEGMIQAGAVSQLDVVNFHAYDYQGGVKLGGFSNIANWGNNYATDPVMVPKLAFIHNVLSKYGLDNKPLMNTEVALLKVGGTCDAICQENKAMYVARAYPVAIAEGLSANIWFQSGNGWHNSGLYGGPQYDSFVFVRKELGNASVIRKITDYNGSAVDGYEFDRGDVKVWVLWSLDLADHSISLPGTPKAVYTWTPNDGPYTSATPSTTLSVGIFPVYLEWSK